MLAFKRIGLVKVLYYLVLLMIPVVLTFLYLDKTIGTAAWIILSLASLAFIGLNIHDQKLIAVKKEKKLMEQAEHMIQKREWNHAIQALDDVLAMDCKNYKAAMGRGYCFRQKTDYRSAIEAYRAAVKINENIPDAHFLLGICCFKERLMKEATSSFERVIKLKPDNQEAYLFLGDIHRFWGDREKSKKYYEAYLERTDDENIRKTVE